MIQQEMIFLFRHRVGEPEKTDEILKTLRFSFNRALYTVYFYQDVSKAVSMAYGLNSLHSIFNHIPKKGHGLSVSDLIGAYLYG